MKMTNYSPNNQPDYGNQQKFVSEQQEALLRRLDQLPLDQRQKAKLQSGIVKMDDAAAAKMVLDLTDLFDTDIPNALESLRGIVKEDE